MHRSDPFVGRREELALIRRAAERAQTGRAQFVVLEGFTGSGKTRLLHQAMEHHLDWNERTILLDDSFTARDGSGVRHLLGAGTEHYEDLEALLASAFDAAQNLRQPYLMSVKNLHLIDEVSADALWRALSIFQNGPVLVVLSTHGSVRPEVQRLIRLAQASPRGTYIALQPLPRREVVELLEAYSSLPIAAPVAARVLEETDGYPGLVERVGRWLRQVPAGSRSIDDALAATVRSADYRGMHRDVLTQMNWLQETDRRAVALLSAADTSLTRSQLESVLGAEVDPAALMSTSLISWEELTGRYAVHRRSLSRAVLSGTSEAERAELLRELSTVLDDEDAVRHLAEAIRLDPTQGDAAVATAQLHAHAARAAARQDFREAFDLMMAAVAMSLQDSDSLSLLAGLAVRTNRVSRLQALEPAIRAAPAATWRSGILALLMLQRADLEGALQELESNPPGLDPGLPLFAEAVIEVSARLLSESLRSRGAALAMRLDSALHAALSGDDVPGVVGQVWDRGQLLGMVALNTLWLELSAEDQDDARAMIGHVSVQLDRLRGSTGVERFEGSLYAVRGALHRQVGAMNQAYQDLSLAAAQDGTISYVMYARSQLALLLFSAAYWDEAEQMADRAAGEALAVGENAVSHVAYAVSAVVPAARGEVQKARARLEVLHESHFAKGPLVTGTIDWAEACLAASQNDFRGVARNLLSMRNDGAAWWAMEPQAVSMLARSLHVSGWAAMLPALLRSAEEDPVVGDFQQHLTTPYLRGFERWAAGAPQEAMESFLEVQRGYDASEPIRPTQPPGEGGGFRVFRAMLSLDIATLVTTYPQELSRHRTTALELAVWSASVLQSCGAEVHLDRANQLMESLRPRIAPQQPADSATQDSAIPSESGAGYAQFSSVTSASPRAAGRSLPGSPPVLSARAEQALRGLSRREQQVALLVSEGLTNREVAERLVLSVRTVEYHVANVMSKLQLSSRRTLRGLVREG